MSKCQEVQPTQPAEANLRRCSSMKKVCATGAGSASPVPVENDVHLHVLWHERGTCAGTCQVHTQQSSPVVSMMMPSKFRLRSSSSVSALTRSPRTAEQ